MNIEEITQWHSRAQSLRSAMPACELALSGARELAGVWRDVQPVWAAYWENEANALQDEYDTLSWLYEEANHNAATGAAEGPSDE